MLPLAFFSVGIERSPPGRRDHLNLKGIDENNWEHMSGLRAQSPFSISSFVHLLCACVPMCGVIFVALSLCQEHCLNICYMPKCAIYRIGNVPNTLCYVPGPSSNNLCCFRLLHALVETSACSECTLEYKRVSPMKVGPVWKSVLS